MNNTNTPFIIVKLDTERKFRLSNKAFYIYETTFNKQIFEIEETGIGVAEVNQLIYAGLKTQDDKITFDEVVDIIDNHGNLEELIKMLTECIYGSSFLERKDSNKQEEKTVEGK